MDARVIRLEERTELFSKQFDRMNARMDAIDDKLAAITRDVARLPTREFLIGALIACFAAALGAAALTFNIADHAAEQAAPDQRQAAPAQQPVVIVLPAAAVAPPASAPAPSVPPIAPDAAKP